MTDIQRKALLKGEVKKLQANGMGYTEAFQTAYEGHPEWHPVGEYRLAGGHAARRAGATMINDGSAGDIDRSAEIQRLVAAYMKSHPAATYNVAFGAVLRDPANKALAASLHRPGKTPGNMLGKFGSGAGTHRQFHTDHKGKASWHRFNPSAASGAAGPITKGEHDTETQSEIGSGP